MFDPNEIDIRVLLRINEMDLESELATCSSYFYTVSALSVEAEELAERAQIALETHEVTLAQQYKGADEDVKETHIKRLFKSDPKWNELKNKQQEIHKQHKLLQKAALSFEMKSRLLMSLNRRDLFKQGLKSQITE